ncbi:MAG: universal stress protein, partial [Sedimenticolaceae bacterium]
MKRFKNILLTVDFDSKQQTAVDRAVSLAKQNDACLTVFSVVKELPADARMAITSMPPQELLERVMV